MNAIQTAYRDMRRDSISDNSVEIWNVTTKEVFTRVGTSEIEKFNKENYEVSEFD